MENNQESKKAKRHFLRSFPVTASAAGITPAGEIDGIVALILTLGFGIILFFIYYAATSLFHVFTFLSSQIEDKVMLGSLVAFCALLVGVCLYILRERWRVIYAALEIAIAIVTSGVAASKLKTQGTQGDLSVWLAFATSSYLVVRGMDNLRTAGVTFGKAWDEFLRGRLVTKKHRT